MHPLVNIGIKAAREGGRLMRRAYDEKPPLQIETKGQHDYVTQVDRAVEDTILRVIQKAYPYHSIQSEECGEIQGDDITWIIDPLDGTTNFVHGFPQFCVSIAVKERGRIEHGVIYDPIRDELFTATRGQGAQVNARRMRVSTTLDLDTSLLGTGFPFRDNRFLADYMAIFKTLCPMTSGIRRAGAAALDLAYVAAGRLDGFWEYGLQDWDFAAAALMIQEAGGIVSTFDGDTELLGKGTLVAGNMKTHPLLLDIIQTAPKRLA
jgi:myo-inositol-1(or 4)-monophosphatase